MCVCVWSGGRDVGRKGRVGAVPAARAMPLPLLPRVCHLPSTALSPLNSSPDVLGAVEVVDDGQLVGLETAVGVGGLGRGGWRAGIQKASSVA